jgi:hypothetical protein
MKSGARTIKDIYFVSLHIYLHSSILTGGQNYARYLMFFSVFLANIKIFHPGATDLLKRGAISVARSFVPGNRCPVDNTIEETFMNLRTLGLRFSLYQKRKKNIAPLFCQFLS